MKILVISDSHRIVRNAATVLKCMGDTVDTVIHLGDHYSDVPLIMSNSSIPYYSVYGNSDYESEAVYEKVITISGKRFFITHGHTYYVNIGVKKLAAEAIKRKADICLFGHTHAAEYFYDNNILFLNPGSISQPRNSDFPTYGIIEIINDEIKPYIETLNTENLEG